jgi:hypothetical protein
MVYVTLSNVKLLLHIMQTSIELLHLLQVVPSLYIKSDQLNSCITLNTRHTFYTVFPVEKLRCILNFFPKTHIQKLDAS